jgi:hypothetical protein
LVAREFLKIDDIVVGIEDGFKDYERTLLDKGI